ncbi:hypothetical protein AKJ55_00790 [candidate division MSBL1 archaeon SCGC-AAA382M17]|uniref:GOLD domain-containing protein n=1 Tax=candidate division MSBL1 archaeon SCGC-AAA382M17 TaxID=1698284 RepID=A0ABR5TJQ0_9EURY|nr:hypothetical protein AKJ55_00790 [candidate division MSBL1 archaeon SCGC-AAA382M17]
MGKEHGMNLDKKRWVIILAFIVISIGAGSYFLFFNNTNPIASQNDAGIEGDAPDKYQTPPQKARHLDLQGPIGPIWYEGEVGWYSNDACDSSDLYRFNVEEGTKVKVSAYSKTKNFEVEYTLWFDADTKELDLIGRREAAYEQKTSNNVIEFTPEDKGICYLNIDSVQRSDFLKNGEYTFGIVD